MSGLNVLDVGIGNLLISSQGFCFDFDFDFDWVQS